MDYYVSSKVEQRGVLAGMLLGVAKKDQNNFFIQHSIAKQDYLIFKKGVLEAITRKPVQMRDREMKRGYSQIQIQPKLIPLIRVMVQRIYHQGQKVITRQFLDYLTPQGIAIWFLDKGSKSFKKKDGKIHALEVTLNTNISKEENELIIAYFSETWGLQWGLQAGKQGYSLRMGTKAGKQLFDFLLPYVPMFMLYKIESSYDSNDHHLPAQINAHGEGIVQRVRKLTQI